MVKNKQDKNQDTEELILKAANRVFEKKGYAGARMQEIADEAGINKALLHYYFRSKEKLFDRIFREAFSQFWPSIEKVTQGGMAGIRDLIKAVIDGYTEILAQRPYLPAFVVGELNRSPERIKELLLASGIKPDKIIKIVQDAIDNGEVVNMDPRELLVNIIALSIFPFIARPLVSSMFWKSKGEYDSFLQKRKETVYEFICRSILVNPDQ
ncbi:TetR/AcrR family transcriptional regulator [Thermophagus xiamenensis]|uniref:Transcriptional regulator, TetR family n=1 Tax=Thermophagus xiamenensis TaxID=385682 RepID=A0A1I2F6I8_9BACT|nr:TetR/AcrR family transcriptional regulator [Thermophagus xiamenensis]SFF00226.1 transcriptional regulator, TetR family [Thermophagus xiamenensis]